jgi:outer membrane protein OmpA-like peptidoglycan-associated protein
MKKVSGILCILILLNSLCSSAQTDSIKLSEQYFLEGMDAYNFTHRSQASELFALAVSANPKSAKANFMAGKATIESSQKGKALPYFLKARKLDPAIDEDILFFIGKAFHYSEQFDSALFYFYQYRQQLSRALRFERSLKVNEVNWKIFECNNAKVYKSNPVKVAMINLDNNINSEFPDYAPTITADESVMVFTTRRPEKNYNPALAQDLEYYEEIHVSKKVDGKWQPSVNLGGPLNSAFHNASVSLSPDGTEMFMYKDENGGDIYEADIQADGTWSTPKRLNGFINSPYLENAASVTSDNKQLFFVSNRPGGYGGSDIYSASLNKRGEWGQVKNLGSVINTGRDEEDVYISVKGNHLYFSSNGHAGMGDLDIYRSSFDSLTQQWSEPINMGYPFNSVENDFYFTLNGDERFAYISSIRQDTKGDEDIYRIDLKEWRPIPKSELITNEISLSKQKEVVDVNNILVPGQAATIPTNTELILKTLDGESGQLIDASVELVNESKQKISLAVNPDGMFHYPIKSGSSSKFQLSVSANGYKPYTSTIHFLGQSTYASAVIEEIALHKEEKKYFQVMNLYYDVNNVKARNEEDLLMVLQLMKDNLSTTITITSFTDNNGSEQYNLELSKRRAETTKLFLIEGGISESRIRASGLGESQPKGNNDSYLGRKINRRSELVIE